MNKRKYYQIDLNERAADINIYGDIRSYEWYDSDVSAFNIKKEIDNLDVDRINIFINSYGGEVAEAIAIYSSLKRHSATIHTFCDGFACSAATIIFCAGETRTMGALALLMIHNCMSYLGYANSEEMRKAAEDNDKINSASIEAYKQASNLSESEIKEKMDNESWLTAQECLEYGFATEIADIEEDTEQTIQHTRESLRAAVLGRGQEPTLADIMHKLDAIQEELNEEEEEEEQDDPKDPDEEDEKPEERLREKTINFFREII